MLATLSEEPFSNPGWLFEIKYDGVRVLAWRENDRVELRGRSGQDFAGRYPEVTAALRALPLDRFCLDAEVVALDETGRASFQLRQEFVIGGYTEPQGSRARFGALHLGLYDQGRLVYVSKVGTGFDDATLDRVWEKLGPLDRATPPFASGTPAGRGHHWVEPRLVCEVRFTEWTRDGGIRHPAFLGLREDKRPEECVREVPVEARGGEAEGTTPPRTKVILRRPAGAS